GLPKINPLTNQPIIGGKGIDIIGNYIGTNTTGTARLGNGFDGVLIAADAVDNIVSRNVIAFNGRNGIFIPRTTPNSPSNNPGVRNSLTDNLIYQNAALGIDLQDAGITPNDPLDTDGGANLQQNFPTLISVTPSAPAAKREVSPDSVQATVTVNGAFNSTPNAVFTVHWYFAADAQCLNNQEQTMPLVTGKIPGITTNAQGNATFSFPFTFPPNINAGVINATATDTQNNTSEFSPCQPINATQTTPRTFQFSQSGYTFSESAGNALLTVTRLGDASGTDTVNYATTDNTAAVRCDNTTTLPGVAFARCDYATSLDTLTFAPGETQKNFSVPLINDAHVEPSETFQVVLSAPSAGITLGTPATATVTITDNDTAATPNPIFSSPFFVRLQYLDFL
ncbi:MAG TPA: Calx-beta domain-containing protein, partial [Pyrinomonadaceae bacterium]|nr:Calx-beta domain-containing protein [Pyrinomonadaceae bacterium]